MNKDTIFFNFETVPYFFQHLASPSSHTELYSVQHLLLLSPISPPASLSRYAFVPLCHQLIDNIVKVYFL